MSIDLRQVDPATRSDELVLRMVAARTRWQYGEGSAARRRADEVMARLLADSLLVDLVAGGEREGVVGFAWLRTDGDAVDVLDSRLDSPGLAPQLCDRLLTFASAEGAARLRASAPAGDPDRRRLIEAGGFVLAATDMRLDLTGSEPPAEERIRLAPMTDEGFAAFIAASSASYALEREEAGDSREHAETVAREQLAELLPAGRHSEHQHFFTAEDPEQAGHLWLDTSQPAAYVYDVEVLPERRGSGLGRAIMRAAARWAWERGAIALRLNVFAHNIAARRLYDGLGYAVTEDHYQRAVDRP